VLSLDDFGTGFSALLHLQQIPLSVLKIDRGFVAAIDTDPDAERLIVGIMALARSLGLDVVAEGIERAEQADVLRRLGCTYGQGYHFARPSTAAEMIELVGERASMAGRDEPHLATAAGAELHAIGPA
jgi:EAL domain-containing protein (putative c-di-GMP-specific phosphodiesterase class I)